MSFKILAINPGSTSTKVALFEEQRPLLDLTLRHSAEEIAQFPRIIDQLDWRMGIITRALQEQNFDLKSLSAVIGRGGLVKPIPGGVYHVNETMKRDLYSATLEHASNLGGLLADQIATIVGIKAYIADPVVVDELDDVARVSGLPECPRRSIFHALNQKAIARLHCRENGLEYEKCNLIVAHLGGGISVGAHHNGRVIDVNNALDGEGPIAPERAGTLPAGALADLCFSGKYTASEIAKLLCGKGGMVAHLNSNAVGDTVRATAKSGDKKAQLILDAICYTISKQIGAMATVLSGQVDAILITGGIAHNAPITDAIADRCSFIAPVKVYPGENELEALAQNALMVLRGEVKSQEYV